MNAISTITNPAVTYNWSLASALTSNATLSASSGTSTTVTYATMTESDKTGNLTLNAYVTENSSTASSTNASITLKALPKFYYTASALVGNVAGGTATVSPSGNGQVIGASGASSASQSFTYTATVTNTDIYAFKGWSTTADGASILSSNNPYTHTTAISGTASSRTEVKLYAIFKGLAKLEVTSSPTDKGYVYSNGDNPTTPPWGTWTNDLTTRTDGADHTMYMYVKPVEHVVGGETLYQYKCKGWSSSNSLDDIDYPVTHPTYDYQAITVHAGEHLHYYAMFVNYFTFTTAATAYTDGSASTTGGTVTAKFSNNLSSIEYDHATATSRSETVTYTATPANEGYTFEGWYNNADLAEGHRVSTSATYSHSLTNSATGTTVSETLYASFRQRVVATPAISFNNGNNLVTITCATGSSTIYYTTDGTTPTTSSTPYTAAFSVTTPQTVKAIAVRQYYRNSDMASLAIAQVATPTLTQVGNTMKIECATAGATIRYTTDGTTPNASSPEYPGPISGIPSNTTVKAIAIKSGYIHSAVGDGLYKETLPTPTFSFNNTTNKLTISSITGASIYYTNNGDTPTSAAAHYTEPITVNTDNTTVKALATHANYYDSPIGTVTIHKVATPAVTKVGSTVEMSCTTDGATIHYTTGTTTAPPADPTASSPTYSAALTDLASGTVVKAIAIKDQWINSEVQAMTFTMQLDPPTITFNNDNNQATITAFAGATIYYTLDGTTPTTSSTAYTGTIDISAATTIKAYATLTDYNPSTISTLAIGKVATPVISQDGNRILMSCTTDGAAIHYTIDGSIPTSASPIYSNALEGVPTGSTVKAFATKPNNIHSDQAIPYYFRAQLDPPTITFDNTTNRVAITHPVDGVTIYYTTDGSDPTTSGTRVSYSSQFDLSPLQPTTIRACAVHSAYTASTASSLAIGQVATPTINQDGNQVTIACTTSGAIIRYTIDGTTPTATSTIYTQALTGLESGTTITAIAFKTNCITSGEASLTYRQQLTAPTITFDYTTGKATITSITGATIHYTTDGSNPTATSPTYSGPFTVSAATTIKAYATHTSYNPSTISSLTVGVVATPVVSQSNGAMQITCTTPGATIYYTTDGSTPTATSSVYYTPLTGLASGTTVKAIATRSGMITSAVGSGVFHDQVPTPEIAFAPTGATATATLTCSLAGATIYYTTDGTTPTTSSTAYTAPFSVPSGTTVKAIAAKTDWTNSEVSSATFRAQLEPPTITFSSPNTVTITSIAGAVIRYTTDGTTPTSTSTTYSSPFTISGTTTVKAYASHTNYIDSRVASLSISQVPTPEIQIVGNRVWFLCDLDGASLYYTTDGTDPTTSSTLWNGSEMTTIADGSTIKVFATKSGYYPSEVATKTKQAAHVVYLDFTDGSDANDGLTAATAKKTWAGAYALLGFGPNATYLRGKWSANSLAVATHSAFNGDAVSTVYTNTVDNNIIYLVGDVTASQLNELMNYSAVNAPTSEQTMMNTIVGSGYFKPATISGKYATSHSDADGAYAIINMAPGTNYALKEDTRFEYVEFLGGTNSNKDETQFILCYYDLEMGKGIRVQNFLSTHSFNRYHHGYAKGVTNTAHILFYGGVVNDSRFTSATGKELQFDYYLPHPDGYKITIRSGYFSTISPGGKQWNSNINGTMGSPNTPVKCTITVDIDRAWNDRHKSGVVMNQAADTLGDPNCDVAVLIAGTHEGSMYGDVDIIVKSGRIDRVVNGTFGAHNQITGYPCDSYFGRANILIDPREPSAAEVTAGYANKNQLVVIRELYGGGLGRYKSTSGSAEAATNFYGKSTVTINGGTFSSAIYASGAGGCNGIGDDSHSAVDQYLPYWSSSAMTAVSYGNYNTWKTSNYKLKVTCHNSATANDTTMIDLARTSTRIAIHGGIFGSSSAPIDGIFGGGYGFVDNELIRYAGVPPHTQAGCILGVAGQLASSLTIDGTTEVWGNVYGAGRGSDTYYNNGRTSYTNLALINGNVQLTIGGNAVIHGSVHGAGQGIAGMDNMARLYGNSTLTIKDNAVITGGVYGGGQNGSMDGSVTLNLLDDALIGTSSTPANVHGGGYGAVTQVNGNIDLNIGLNNTDEPLIYGDVYGGSALGKVNGTSAANTYATDVTLTSGTIHGSLYGGGLGDNSTAANSYGPVAVKVYGGSVKTTGTPGSGGVYGANNVNGAPQLGATVDIYGTDPAPAANQYALAYVFGGGNKAAYTYGNGYPKVTVHNCNNSIEYVFGGGNAAAVASTDVTIYGGNVIGNVFGGGNGVSGAAPVNGNATTKIYGGTIRNVFGGSNQNGAISGTINLTIEDRAESSGTPCGMTLGCVYGGGNQASSSPGIICVNCFEGRIEEIYGGANNANINGNIALNIQGGNFGKVFGGNNAGGTVNGNIAVTVTKALSCGLNVDYVYGGGNAAAVGTNSQSQTVSVTVMGGARVNEMVFGGGLGANAVIYGNTNVLIKGSDTSVGRNVYGGGNGGAVTGNTGVKIGE